MRSSSRKSKPLRRTIRWQNCCSCLSDSRRKAFQLTPLTIITWFSYLLSTKSFSGSLTSWMRWINSVTIWTETSLSSTSPWKWCSRPWRNMKMSILMIANNILVMTYWRWIRSIQIIRAPSWGWIPWSSFLNGKIKI